MSLLEIRQLGDPILRQRAEVVTRFDEELRRLADDMLESMYAGEGIGLAAPQVGVLQRLFVMDVRTEGAEPRAIVNPVVVEHSGWERGEEGCLSIPGLVGEVGRPARVVLEGLDLTGQPVRIEASGLEARCIQHEIDHLNGVLFIDHLSPLKRRMLLGKWKKEQREARVR
jgi:peptide deformylase